MSEPSQGRSLPWFRVDVDLVDHPKVLALADALDCAEAEAGWLVVRLWAWTMRYAARGRLAPGARPALERLWNGAGTAPESGSVVDALVRAGFLDASEDGGWEVHDWDEHNGAAVAKAEKDAERKRAARARRSSGRGQSADGRADGAGTERNGTGRDGTKEEDQQRPVERGPLVYAAPTTPSHTWTPEDFFRWAQAVRAKAGWVGEKWPKANISHWWSEVLATPGMGPHEAGIDRLRAGFISFGKDDHWRAAKPPAPFQGFMSVWRNHVPPAIPGITSEAS